jgi:hypothetical protein
MKPKFRAFGQQVTAATRGLDEFNRYGLRYAVPWRTTGTRLVGEASDGTGGWDVRLTAAEQQRVNNERARTFGFTNLMLVVL